MYVLYINCWLASHLSTNNDRTNSLHMCLHFGFVVPYFEINTSVCWNWYLSHSAAS